VSAAALAALLRNNQNANDGRCDSDEVVLRSLDASLVATSRDHGVGPLLHRALRERGLLDRLPADVRTALAQIAREEAVLESIRQRQTAQLLEALAAASVRAIVFKGTALAYTCYADPSLRPRLDTDLLIRPEDVAATSAVLESIGFERTARPTGEHVTHQFTYVRAAPGAGSAFDVHWKIADPQAFADLFTHAELSREAVPIRALGPHASGPCDVHALLVACAHRVAHHYDDDTLIFLCDIDVLARRLIATQWDRVVALAGEKQIRAVTARGLDLARRLLGTPVPDDVQRALDAAGRSEATAAYLDPGLRKVDILWSDLHALGGWRARVKLLREHVVPTPDFIRRSYGATSTILLPAFYIHRVLRGVGKWFRPLR
jgi:hypothetical protein